MPFVGTDQHGNVVIPSQVSDDAVVTCPACGGEMLVQTSFFNSGKFISRHFRHRKSQSACGGGESKVHQKMKAIAASRLDTEFHDGSIVVEKQVAPGRIADVVYEFDEPTPPYGDGIACEVQHKNKGKRTGRVTREYLHNDYSVIWAYQSDFDFDNRDFELPDHRFIKVWPNAIPEPEGRDLYPDVTPTRLKDEAREGSGPGVVPATFPEIVRTVHQFDIESPVHGQTPPDWDEFDHRDIHGRTRYKTASTIYGHEELGAFLEFRTVDQNTADGEFVPVPIAPGDAQPLAQFCEAGQQHAEECAGRSPDSWETICAVTLSYNAGLRGRLFFGVSEQGDRQLIVHQYGIFGCVRTHEIDYKPGDFERFRPAVEVVEHVYEPQYPFSE